MMHQDGVFGRSSAVSETGAWIWAVGLAAVYLAIFLAFPRIYLGVEMVDAESYFDFWAIRTAYYPTFLHAMTMVGLGQSEIASFQSALFFAALIFLLKTLIDIGVPRAIVVVFTLLTAANFYFNSFHDAIHTESISFSLTMIFLAAFLRYLTRYSLIAILVVGLAIGFGAGFRPSFAFFAPAVVVALIAHQWIDRGRLVASLLAFLVGFGVALAPEPVIYHAQHAERDSLGPRHLFGKGVMIVVDERFDVEAMEPEFQPLAEAIRRDFADDWAVLAERSRGDIVERALYTQLYELPAQWNPTWLRPELAAAAADLGVSEFEVMERFGKDAVASAPLIFLRTAFDNYVANWVVGGRFVYGEVLEAAPRLELLGEPEGFSSGFPATLAQVIFYGFLFVGVVSLTLAVVGALTTLVEMLRGRRFELPTAWRVAFYLSLFVQSHLMLTSLTGVALFRYLVAAFPMIVLVGLFLMYGLVNRGDRFARSSGAAATGGVAFGGRQRV